MAAVVSQHVRRLGFLRKTTATFTEISRKHVFAASNRSIIKNSLKKEIRTNFPKT